MDKICGVCGDRAYCYNFGALTCESCRSFFRRAAIKSQVFKCFYGENCEIEYKNRKFCKKCRIDKCFAIGMKKESIRSYGLNKSKNRRTSTSTSIQSSDSTTDSISDGSVSMECIRVNQNNDFKSLQIPNFIRGLIFSLSPFELTQLKELFSASSYLKEPLVKPSSEVKDLLTIKKIMHKRCDIKFRRLVQMSTNLNEFVNLCENDKIVLMKTMSTDLVNLMSFLNYDFEGQYWTVVTDENIGAKISLDFLKNLSQNVYESHQRFLFSIRQQLEDDLNIFDLLIALVLFNPSRPNLMMSHAIRVQEQIFKYLLKRYLEIKCQSKSEAQNRFMRLMNGLQEVYALSHLYELAYSAQPDALKGSGPLVEEIYEMSD